MAEKPILSPRASKIMAIALGVVYLVLTASEKYWPGVTLVSFGADIVAGVAILFGVPILGKPNPGKVAGAGAAVLLIILSTVAVTSCKPPPLAVAYRAYSVGVTARDSTGDLMAKAIKAKVEKCKAGPVDKLKACLKPLQATLAVWVRQVKPAVNTALAAFWAVLESVYAAGDKSLDKMSKVVRVACEQVKAAEVAIGQYGEQLGKYKDMILVPLAGVKVLVCR